ncbi:MAG: hypothetical protein AAF449_10670, partial [Myxococcota bacterium]
TAGQSVVDDLLDAQSPPALEDLLEVMQQDGKIEFIGSGAFNQVYRIPGTDVLIRFGRYTPPSNLSRFEELQLGDDLFADIYLNRRFGSALDNEVPQLQLIERLAGTTLYDFTYNVVPPNEAMEVMRSIGRQYVRLVDEKNVLHGDISPGNVYLVNAGRRNTPPEVRFIDPDSIATIEFTEEGLNAFEDELVRLFNYTSGLRPFSMARFQWNQVFEESLEGISDPRLQEVRDRVLKRIRLGAL